MYAGAHTHDEPEVRNIPAPVTSSDDRSRPVLAILMGLDSRLFKQSKKSVTAESSPSMVILQRHCLSFFNAERASGACAA